MPGGFHLEVAFRASGAPLGILGPSGAGKSLTLRAIAGLERPDRGRIVLDGRVLFDSAGGIDCPSRDRRVGLLFQNYALFPHLTVAQNIAFGISALPEDERDRRVADQIARCISPASKPAIPRRFPAVSSNASLWRARSRPNRTRFFSTNRFPRSMRTCAARSNANCAKLWRLSRRRLFVSHNLEEAYRFCDELVVLANGQIVAAGPKEELFRRPPNFEVARLTGCKNFSARPPRSRASSKRSTGDAACASRNARPPRSATSPFARTTCASTPPVRKLRRPARAVRPIPRWVQARTQAAARTRFRAGSPPPPKRRSASRSICA